MKFEEVLRGRNSVRDFTDQPVSDTLLESLLEQALCAPSSTNTQAYRVAIAQGEVKNRLAAKLCSTYDKAIEVQKLKGPMKVIKGLSSGALPKGDFKIDMSYPPELKKRAIECGKGLYGLLNIERHDRVGRDAWMRRNFEFFDAPVEIFLFVHGDRPTHSALDAGMFFQNLMLAAKAAGLGTCAQASVAMWSKTVRSFFEIEEGYKLICGMALGYPSGAEVNRYQPSKRSVKELCLPVRPL